MPKGAVYRLVKWNPDFGSPPFWGKDETSALIVEDKKQIAKAILEARQQQGGQSVTETPKLKLVTNGEQENTINEQE
jgi:hypothetical protein